MARRRHIFLPSAAAAAALGGALLPSAGAFSFSDLVPTGMMGGGSTAAKHATDELDDKTFDTFMKEHPVSAILFYAPWCFYSQQMLPSWDTAHQKLLLHDPPIYLAKIDAHRYGSVGDRYGVNAFPTMKLFADDAIFEYDSNRGRGWQQIVKWVNEHLDRDHILKNGDDVEQYLHDNDLNVVGLFPDGYNSSSFAKSSRHFADVIFAEARGTEVSKDVATHLARHASLVCETISVGGSGENTKKVDLPREKLNCSGTPRNPQRPDWSDRFGVVVEGTKLTVKREDEAGGWLQNLQIKCCDEESSTSSSSKYKIEVPSIVMFTPHDERFSIFDGDIRDGHAVDRWISARRSPMITRLTMETADKILEPGPEKMPVVFFIAQTEQPAAEAELRKAAAQVRGRVMIVFSGAGSQLERRLMDVAGVEAGAPPVVTLIETHAAGGGQIHVAKKYRLTAPAITADAVVQFVADYEKGRLTPWLRSEPEPTAEDQALDPVGILVGTTFKKHAEDTESDVLIDFYAPWCGHCRKFEPHYKGLARKLKHVKTLKIMKIDATRNEMEGMQIAGFPTIMLFPAGSLPKRPVQYHGNREEDDMVRWLQESCTKKFNPKPTAAEAAAAKDPVSSGLLDPSEEDL